MGFLSRFLANSALRTLIVRIATEDVAYAFCLEIPLRRGTEKLQSLEAMLAAQFRDGLSALFDEINHVSNIPCPQRIGILLFCRAACTQLLITEARTILLRPPKGVHHFEK